MSTVHKFSITLITFVVSMLVVFQTPQVSAKASIYNGMNLEVNASATGETVKEGDTVRITWTGSASITEVSIFAFNCPLCLQGIATHIPNTKSYDWKVATQSPQGKSGLSFLVIGYNAEGASVTDESDAVMPYQPPSNATPVPTPDPENLSSYDMELIGSFLQPEFKSFQMTLSPGVMDTWPKAGSSKQVEIEQEKPIMVAFPDPETLPHSTILFVDDPYVYCFGTSTNQEVKNRVLTCQAKGIGKTAIVMLQIASDGTLQLSKEIIVNVKKGISPSPSSTPTSSPTPTPKLLRLFSDLSEKNPLAPAITTLKEKGIIGGYPDGTFKPNAPVNRGEFTKMVVGALTQDPGNGKTCFTDVHDEWFAKYVCYAREHSIINGYPDGNFHPERNINYVEAVKIVMLAFGRMESGDTEGKHWYDKYLAAAKNRGFLTLITGIANSDPSTSTTRAQTAQLIVNTMR